MAKKNEYETSLELAWELVEEIWHAIETPYLLSLLQKYEVAPGEGKDHLKTYWAAYQDVIKKTSPATLFNEKTPVEVWTHELRTNLALLKGSATALDPSGNKLRTTEYIRTKGMMKTLYLALRGYVLEQNVIDEEITPDSDQTIYFLAIFFVGGFLAATQAWPK